MERARRVAASRLYGGATGLAAIQEMKNIYQRFVQLYMRDGGATLTALVDAYKAKTAAGTNPPELAKLRVLRDDYNKAFAFYNTYRMCSGPTSSQCVKEGELPLISQTVDLIPKAFQVATAYEQVLQGSTWQSQAYAAASEYASQGYDWLSKKAEEAKKATSDFIYMPERAATAEEKAAGAGNMLQDVNWTNAAIAGVGTAAALGALYLGGKWLFGKKKPKLEEVAALQYTNPEKFMGMLKEFYHHKSTTVEERCAVLKLISKQNKLDQYLSILQVPYHQRSNLLTICNLDAGGSGSGPTLSSISASVPRVWLPPAAAGNPAKQRTPEMDLVNQRAEMLAGRAVEQVRMLGLDAQLEAAKHEKAQAELRALRQQLLFQKFQQQELQQKLAAMGSGAGGTSKAAPSPVQRAAALSGKGASHPTPKQAKEALQELDDLERAIEKGAPTPKRMGAPTPKRKSEGSPKRKGAPTPKRKSEASPKRKSEASPKRKSEASVHAPSPKKRKGSSTTSSTPKRKKSK